MSYVMRAKSISGDYITWISQSIDLSGSYAPTAIQPGTAIVAMETLAVNLDGYVVGPASAVDNAIARFDLTTGKLIQNSTVTIHDDGHIVLPNNAALYWKSTLGNNVYGLGLAEDNIFRIGVDGYNSYVRGNSVSLCPDDNIKYIFENAQFTIKDQCDIRLNNIANTRYTTFKGADVASNISFTLPTTQGSANQVLNTNGSGQCGWTTLPNFDGYLTISDLPNLDGYVVGSDLDGYLTTASLLGWGSSLGISNTSDGYTVNLSGNSTLSSINQNITIDPQDGYDVNIGNTGDVLLSTAGTAVTIHNNLIMLNDGYSITAPAGENLNIILPATSNATPGYLIATAGSCVGTGNGGAINITGGETTGDGYFGGTVQLSGGAATLGTGGSVTLLGAVGEIGGNVNIIPGNGSITDGTINFHNGDGNICAYFLGNSLTGNSTLHLVGKSDSSSPGSPGSVIVQGGASTLLGSGGAITILGGSGEGDGYLGGTVSITGGSNTLGTGGAAIVAGGNGATGGSVVLRPGDGATDGRIEFQKANSVVSIYIDTTSNAIFGNIDLSLYGAAATISTDPGDVTINGGSSNYGDAGNVSISGGQADSAGDSGGNIYINSGSNIGGDSSTGGDIDIITGYGDASSGNITLQTGAGNSCAYILGKNGTIIQDIIPNVVSKPRATQIDLREKCWIVEKTDGAAFTCDFDITSMGGIDGYDRTYIVEYDVAIACNSFTSTQILYEKIIAGWTKTAANALSVYGANIVHTLSQGSDTTFTAATSAPDAVTLRLTIDPVVVNCRFLIRAKLFPTGGYSQ
jgi:hypothetical protein